MGSPRPPGFAKVYFPERTYNPEQGGSQTPPLAGRFLEVSC